MKGRGARRRKTRTVALVVNAVKRGARDAASEIARLVARRGARLIADPGTARLLGDTRISRDDRGIRAEADLAVSVGGDGTVLRAARIIAGSRIPLLGINLGGLGFLTASARAGARECVTAALAGRCRSEERMMLEVSLARGGKEICSHAVLNDAVISKGAVSRLMALDAFVGEEYLVTYVSDGLIISSPTGSTAYSLSAGGALVNPDMDAIMLTPICPHMLTNRPMIVPGSKTVRVRISTRGRDAALTLDGQESRALLDGDEVAVSGGGTRLTLLASPRKTHYQLLREKLHWGGRSLHG